MISVVMPVRDGAAHVADALASAEAAGAGEVVVIDGHSRDDTCAIARGFPFVRLLEQRGSSLAGAFNEGMEAASGDRLAFLGHDDVYEPGALTALDAALGDAAAAFGQVRFEVLGGVAPPGFRPELLDGPRPALLLETMLISRAAVERLGQLRLITAHDADWFARLHESGLPVVRAPVLVSRKRMRAESWGHARAAEDPTHLVRAARDAIVRRRQASA